ncbi:LacI family DNA-binding transcriptional regulator [Microvirga alba]|uniref:LacI family DNA-binding transcriptional regulator n=1 Tax=Microvirga alba TaxID=2791025 RepID=A0A931BSP0_9HYPH|nr:LacI family DNA-binding transcriptional regulator [Microvirga alba]MBF9233943.1 LacI family DNA-binding transcriptional regulator [Microvirga alba]
MTSDSSKISPSSLGRSRLRDIARACDVSISTVSRALAGQKGVRDDVRQRIIEAAKTARYPMANSFSGNRIAVFASPAAMTDYSRSQFTWHVLEGLKSAAAAYEIEISLIPLADGDDQYSSLHDVLADRNVRGVLLLTVDDPQILDRVHASGKAAVLINSDDPSMRISSVSPCNRSAARLACDYLIGLGHSRIAFVMKPGRVTIQRRLEGWADALHEHRLPHPPEYVIRVDDWTPECAERAIGDRLDRRALDATALLCAADSLALGALSALASRNISCPDDISVLGIDDLPISDLLKPRLTTIHIPARELGETAVEALVELATQGQRLVRRTELACRLIIRDSTASATTEDPKGHQNVEAIQTTSRGR